MQLSLPAVARPPVLTVSELNERIRRLLDRNFAEVWVGGEISNLRIPASGHLYFTLKDDRSQLNAVMFRSAVRLLKFRPENGMNVVARGRVGIYDARGDVQLYVDSIEPQGLGALQLALEQLKKKLAAEGLFDEARKRPLPACPNAVGIVTARTGAAVHDMVVTLRRRMPGLRVVLRPVQVQGAGAAADIAAAIADLNQHAEVDVLIVGRGGGSLEDLWTFNDEAVVRAIAGSTIPVVSAVGHETDFTLADFAADVRAATPTAAATLVAADGVERRRHLFAASRALAQAMRGLQQRERQRLALLGRRLRDPRQVLRQSRIRIDELSERSQRAVEGALRLGRARLRGQSERLEALSPLAVLNRGYAIVQKDALVVRSAAEVAAGDLVILRFAASTVRARIVGEKA
jgi:exodeoxyribonuclease VII large subunit